METARGTIEVTLPEQEPGKGPVKTTKKGPITQSLIKAGLVIDKEGKEEEESACIKNTSSPIG